MIGPKIQEEKARRARMTIRKAKVWMPRAKERKEKEIRQEKKAWQHATLVGSQDILLGTVGGTIFDRRQAI